MNKEKKLFELKAHSYQIADTGDYDGHYEITNGKISIFTKDDTEDGYLEKVVEALNETGCEFYLDDSNTYLMYEFEKRANTLSTFLQELIAVIPEEASDTIKKIIDKAKPHL